MKVIRYKIVSRYFMERWAGKPMNADEQKPKKYPSQEADKVLLRLPDGWRDAIKAEAAKSRRAMNSEILAAIEVAMRIKGVQLERPS